MRLHRMGAPDRCRDQPLYIVLMWQFYGQLIRNQPRLAWPNLPASLHHLMVLVTTALGLVGVQVDLHLRLTSAASLGPTSSTLVPGPDMGLMELIATAGSQRRCFGPCH